MDRTPRAHGARCGHTQRRAAIVLTALVGSSAAMPAAAPAAAPDGAGPWADSVVAATQGGRKDGDKPLGARSVPASALGVAERSTKDGVFYSLGFNGEIVLGYENPICNGPGPDLRLVESTREDPDAQGAPYPDDLTDVFVSDDGTNFVQVADRFPVSGDLDLPAAVRRARFVRLVDDTPFDRSRSLADGYDVNGVAALQPSSACPADLAPGTGTGAVGTSTSGTAGGGVLGTAVLGACVATSGFTGTAATRRARGLDLRFGRRVANPVTVDVFRTSRGRRVVLNQRVARFTNRSTSFRWNGRGARVDGIYFVRYRIRTASGATDTRRHTLARVNGRFRARPSHYRRESCGLVRTYKLDYPGFAGVQRRPLRFAYHLTRGARVQVQVLRGSRVVQTFAASPRAAGRTFRFTVPLSSTVRRGDYRVRLTAVAGASTVRATLTSRRL